MQKVSLELVQTRVGLFATYHSFQIEQIIYIFYECDFGGHLALFQIGLAVQTRCFYVTIVGF
jgi:hypothetical protein